jgi:hypothetical protein
LLPVAARAEYPYTLLAGAFLPDSEVIMSRSVLIGCSLLVGLVFVVGCGNKELKVGAVPVTGLVLLDNQPAVGVTVSFSPDDPKVGMAAVGTTDSSGRFTLTTKIAGDGAIPGSYGVMISKAASSATTVIAEDPRSSGGKLSEDQIKTVFEGMKQSKKGAGAPSSEIPARYASKDTSGFTAVVEAGKTNDFTFAMSK